ncbi:MAG: hypothetical protein AB1813_07570 [Verrucomicrobiota bacterium]|jgi:hypothetical protein
MTDPAPETQPDPLTSPPAPAAPSLEELRASFRSLRLLLNVVLVALILLTTSVLAFLFKEQSMVQKQIVELSKFVADYEKNSVPLMEDFRTKLESFAKAHPDFRPILIKYFGTNAPAPTTQPAPKALPLPPEPAR